MTPETTEDPGVTIETLLAGEQPTDPTAPGATIATSTEEPPPAVPAEPAPEEQKAKRGRKPKTQPEAESKAAAATRLRELQAESAGAVAEKTPAEPKQKVGYIGRRVIFNTSDLANTPLSRPAILIEPAHMLPDEPGEKWQLCYFQYAPFQPCIGLMNIPYSEVPSPGTWSIDPNDPMTRIEAIEARLALLEDA